MRDAFENQESEGRVVVEEVAVGGQIFCHRQPHSLSNDDDISTKVVHLVQSSIVAQYHASEYMSTISYNSFESLACPCLYVISIVVRNSSFTQIKFGHLKRLVG